MLRRVIALEGVQATFKSGLVGRLAGCVDLVYERIDWRGPGPESLKHRADLLLLALSGDPAPPLRFLQRLQANPLSIRPLAIVPDPPDAELLAAAAGATDDFILWPAQAAAGGRLQSNANRVTFEHYYADLKGPQLLG
jgi:hypothetical protein